MKEKKRESVRDGLRATYCTTQGSLTPLSLSRTLSHTHSEKVRVRESEKRKARARDGLKATSGSLQGLLVNKDTHRPMVLR